MKRFLLPALLSALMIAEVHAESFTVSDIRVNGLQRVRPGDTVAPTPVRMALKRELERGNATEKSADNQPEQAKKESVG